MCISLFFRCTKTKKNWFCLDCLTPASQLKSICSFSKKKKITQFSFCRVLLFLWSPHCSSLPLLPLKCSFDNMKRFTRIWIREIPSSSKITTSVPVYKCMWRNKSLSLHLFFALVSHPLPNTCFVDCNSKLSCYALSLQPEMR